MKILSIVHSTGHIDNDRVTVTLTGRELDELVYVTSQHMVEFNAAFNKEWREFIDQEREDNWGF